MSLFTLPNWTIDKSANALSNEFGNTKKKKTKRKTQQQTDRGVHTNGSTLAVRKKQTVISQDKSFKTKGNVIKHNNKDSKKIPKRGWKSTHANGERGTKLKSKHSKGKGESNLKDQKRNKVKGMGAGNVGMQNKHNTEDDMDFPPHFMEIISTIEKRLGKRKFSQTGIDANSKKNEIVKKKKVSKMQEGTKPSRQVVNQLENKGKGNKKKTGRTNTQTDVNKSAQCDVESEVVIFKLPVVKKKYKEPQGSLRERMVNQLKGSRFRYLNEQLYMSSGKDAEYYFKNDPEAFQMYHEGYQRQVSQWPLNPVTKIINAIKRKPSNLIIADFGCGDATLARSVYNPVHSFDLVALSEEVTACDMAHTPLDDSSVDVSVFCLSLMGTDLGDYLIEANRVTKMGGLLKIAEVGSRFYSVDEFVKYLHNYGFKNLHKDLSHNLFYFMDFKKISNIKKTNNLPQISLKPCLYKRR